MPSALEPGVKLPLVLEGDKGKDPEPTFFCKALSLREAREVGLLVDESYQAETTPELFDKVLDLLERVLVGWENIDLEFGREGLENALTHAEARELIRSALMTARVSPEDKKKSD